MNILRTSATRIMSKAVECQSQCLMGLLQENGNLQFCHSADEMQQLMETSDQAVYFYNQHPEAIQFIESQLFEDGQQTIEIFQDTEGVFGLRAYQLSGKMQAPEVLEYQETMHEPG